MVRVLGALVILIGLGACDDSNDVVARAEVDRVKVASGFELVSEGVEEGSNGFAFRLYVGPLRSLEKGVVRPPTDSYETFGLVSNFHEGWRPLTGWRGPSGDREKECLIAAEVAEDLDHLPDELPAAKEEKVRGGDAVLLRVSVDCSEAAHTFD